jgi:hypothetical protein
LVLDGLARRSSNNATKDHNTEEIPTQTPQKNQAWVRICPIFHDPNNDDGIHLNHAATDA